MELYSLKVPRLHIYPVHRSVRVHSRAFRRAHASAMTAVGRCATMLQSKMTGCLDHQFDGQ